MIEVLTFIVRAVLIVMHAVWFVVVVVGFLFIVKKDVCYGSACANANADFN